MAAKRSTSYLYLCAGLVAIAGGAILTGIEVVGTVGYLAGQPIYLVAGGAVLTVVAATLLTFAHLCWKRKQYLLAILLGLALIPAQSVVFTAAVERTGAANDGANRDRQAHENRLSAAKDAETRVKAKVDTAVSEAKAKAEAAEKTATASREAERAECVRTTNPKVSPDGPTCDAKRKQAAIDRADADEKAKALKLARDEGDEAIKSAQDAVVKVGPVPKDPTASRLAAVFPVSEEAVQLYQPLIMPVAIPLTGDLLIATGAHLLMPHSKRRKRRKSRSSWLGWWRRWRGKRKRAKGKAKASSPKAKPPAALPSSAKVIPLRRRKAS